MYAHLPHLFLSIYIAAQVNLQSDISPYFLSFLLSKTGSKMRSRFQAERI